MSSKEIREVEDEFYRYMKEVFDPKTNGKPTEEDMIEFAKHFVNWKMKTLLEDSIHTIVQYDEFEDLVPTISDLSTRGFQLYDDVNVIIINNRKK